jgi:hypothetical protein
MSEICNDFQNAMKLVKLGMAEYVDKDQFSIAEFRGAILKVLEDPGFAKLN